MSAAWYCVLSGAAGHQTRLLLSSIRVSRSSPSTEWAIRGDRKRLQLITAPRVLEGRGWYKAPIIPRVGVCVIATLRRHPRRGAVRTIGTLVCRSRPIRIVVVAVVLSIASSDASNERTNH